MFNSGHFPYLSPTSRLLWRFHGYSNFRYDQIKSWICAYAGTLSRTNDNGKI